MKTSNVIIALCIAVVAFSVLFLFFKKKHSVIKENLSVDAYNTLVYRSNEGNKQFNELLKNPDSSKDKFDNACLIAEFDSKEIIKKHRNLAFQMQASKRAEQARNLMKFAELLTQQITLMKSYINLPESEKTNQLQQIWNKNY